MPAENQETPQPVEGAGTALSGLAAALGTLPARGHPPVESWSPPYCGDIGMRIAADGSWYHQGGPINRPALVKLFASVLRKDADGRSYLVTPVEKYDVVVEDAHFLAVELAAEGSGSEQVLYFRTNVDDLVCCGKGHPLRFGRDPRSGGLKPYLLVRGRLEALLTRACYMELVALADVVLLEGIPQLGVWSAEMFFPMAPAAEIEGLT